MSLHDDYARLTPFEIAFPDRTVIEEQSAAVAKEAAERRLDDGAPEAFMTLLAVGELVRGMRGPDATAQSTYQFSAFLYQCVHFLRAGCPIFLLATATARDLMSAVVAAAPGGGPTPEALEPPTSAGYLQLPQHLVWTEGSPAGSPAGAPESVDGVFWTLAASHTLHALAVTGLRPDRPGFGALALGPAPIADAPIWLDAEVRKGSEDFASSLPGGELDALHSIEAAGEVLKLLARFFALTAGKDVARERRQGGVAADGGPRASALPYTLVSRGG